MKIGFKKDESKIVDGTNLNNFGIQFLDAKATRDFQVLSGMGGPYSVEYQYHYVNAVGRLEADGQRLDIAIPLVMFNYHQEVGGASVEFNLGEVGEASNQAMPLAVKKFEEFSKTKMYQELATMGITDWEIHSMNSNHMHPEGINGFSGTDLRANINHPGVVYPLSTGENVPSFSGMMQHKNGNHAEQIIMEYRIFNGTEGGIRQYEEGRCLTLVRGYKAPETPVTPILPNGVFDNMFGTTRPQPPRAVPELSRDSFILRKHLTPTEGVDVAIEMMKLWEECEFVIDTSMILKTNVLRGRGRLQTKTVKPTTWGNTGNVSSRRNLNEINEGLFGNLADDEDEPTMNEMKQSLLNAGITLQVLKKMTDDQIKTDYEILEFGAETGIIENEYEEPTTQEKFKYLRSKEWILDDLLKLTETELDDMYWRERLDDFEDEEAGISDINIDVIINMLVADNLYTKARLEELSNDTVLEIAEEMYGDLTKLEGV